jgi:hypothetical protein
MAAGSNRLLDSQGQESLLLEVPGESNTLALTILHGTMKHSVPAPASILSFGAARHPTGIVLSDVQTFGLNQTLIESQLSGLSDFFSRAGFPAVWHSPLCVMIRERTMAVEFNSLSRSLKTP